MKDVFLSRRRCLQVSALAGCSMLLGGRVSAAEEPLKAGYNRPGPVTPNGAGQLSSGALQDRLVLDHGSSFALYRQRGCLRTRQRRDSAPIWISGCDMIISVADQ